MNLARQLAECREIVAEDLDGDVRARAGEHVVDAMRDWLADGDVGPREQRDFLSQFLEHGFARPILHLEANIDLGGFDSLHVLIELGSARATRGGGHFRHAEHQPLESIAERVGISEARARDRNRAHGQCALVELGKERSARRDNTDDGGDQERYGRRDHGPPVCERVSEPPLVGAP